jgi:hypothetical protein
MVLVTAQEGILIHHHNFSRITTVTDRWKMDGNTSRMHYTDSSDLCTSSFLASPAVSPNDAVQARGLLTLWVSL